MLHILEALIEERVPHPVPRVGEQRCDRPSANCGFHLVDPLGRGEIGMGRGEHLGTLRFEIMRDFSDARFVGGDDQIVAVLGGEQRQMIADAGRRAGDDRERMGGGRGKTPFMGWQWRVNRADARRVPARPRNNLAATAPRR